MATEILPPAETDQRYRVLVLLQRTDRPSLVKWHCPFCRSFVVELMNAEASLMSDVIDFENTATMGTGYRCNGRTDTGHCRRWFYFTLGAN